MAEVKNKKRVICGFLTVIISSVMAVSIYHLWGTDWRVPLTGYRGDSVGLLLELNNFARGGFVHHHIVYGEPYNSSFFNSLCDYSVVMPMLKLLWHVTGSVEKAVNIQAVINCAATSFCMFFVCTRLKLSDFSAAVAGVLYGNLSFFYLYGNTVMMTYSIGFYLPLFCYVLLEFMRRDGRFAEYNTANALFVLFVMLYTGKGSAYYTFFALIILAFVGLYVLLVRRNPANVWMIIFSYMAIGLGIAVYTVPGILHRLGYTQLVLDMGYGLYVLITVFAVLVLAGIYAILKKIHSHTTIKAMYFAVAALVLLAGAAYVVLRKYTDYIGTYDGRTLYAVEAGSLKAVSMVLPAVNSLFGIGDSILKAITDVGNRQASDFAMIGVMSGVGMAYSAAHIFDYRENDSKNELLKLCGLINCFIMVVAIKGGLSSIVAMFVTTGIRNYNRMCVFIAVFSLIALGILIDRIIDKIRNISKNSMQIAGYAVLAGALLAGICMSVPTDFMYNHTFGFAAYEQRKREYDEWQRYIGSIEEQVPPNGMVLEMPLSMDDTYKGELMTEGRAYELNVPLCIARTTCWNTGAKIRRPLLNILGSDKDISDFLTLAAAYGYQGIYVDTLMYHDDSYKQLLEEFGQYLGGPLICSENRRYFYSLTEYSQKLHEQYSEKELDDIVGDYYEDNK